MKKAGTLKPNVVGSGVFLLVLGVSIFLADFINRQSLASAQAEFETRADSLSAQISRELELTVAVIKAGASAIRLNGDTDGAALRDRLYAYLENGDVLANSPGILSVGFVLNAAFGQPDHDGPLFPLIAVYPHTTSRIIGTDLSFSPERMAALQYAQDTGNTGVGDRIVLLTGAPGVFFAHPIYASEGDFARIEDRRAQTVGMVVAVLRTDSFMVNALNEIDLRGVDFEVHDLGPDAEMAQSLGTETVLASSRMKKMAYSELVPNELLVTLSPDAIKRDVRVGGHTWRILLAPAPDAMVSLGSYVAPTIGIVGMVLAALSGFATYQQLSQSAFLKQRVDRRTRDLQAANSRILKQANEDALTGLGNRRSLSDAIKNMIEERNRSQRQSIAAVHIDLDRFKQINDTMGHAGGDFILCYVADLIRNLFPKDAFCARVGGDEFTVAMDVDAKQQAELEAAAGRLVDACSEPVDFEGRPCRFGASVGIAIEPIDTVDSTSLLINADLALYRAKKDGRGRVKLFSPEIHAEVVSHKNRADDILRAIDAGGEFVPFFQPQLTYATGKLHGVEALARWNHPKLGILSPSEFLPIAQDLDVVARIDRLILEEAIKVANRAHDAGFQVPRLSTNLSFSRLIEDGFVASISNLPKCRSAISFEIVESIFLDEESGPALWNIDRIKEAGMEVEIDDFGSGRASVVALTRVAPNRMKIDRELVAPIAEHEERRQLVQSIVQIGKVLGIGITAEGVETQDQARLLGEMGCDVLQGYLFAAPLSADDFFTFLASGQAGKASA